ncbi:MAG: hypothetical protein EOO06_08220 [Chitinophagaceae bacterium]|nr:MAG: hypothetical protein EOO06_08220 [Chitinophagaceae bacterium]
MINFSLPFTSISGASLLSLFFILPAITVGQNVGIGTTVPVARLHVADSNVLFTGPVTLPNPTLFNPPASGPGTRMMWYAQKGAFRTGTVNGDAWDKDKIGRYSFASGFNGEATADYSTSLGFSTKANGTAALATGVLSTSTGDYSTSMGYATFAGSFATTSLGAGSEAVGSTSLSTGSYTKASGHSSASFGQNTHAKEAGSVAMGSGVIAGSLASLAIGTYNDTSAVNRLFEVGRGSSNLNRLNAFTIVNNGNVGIGNANPVNRLDITGLNNWDLGNTEGDLRIGNGSYRIKMGIALDGAGAGAASIRAVGGINQLNLGAGVNTIITMNGNTANVGIGTADPQQKLHVAGNILATGTITPSDRRYKENIAPLSDPLEKLKALNGVTYNYRAAAFASMGFDSKKQIGLIAQEVEAVFPELVVSDDKGYKAVEYTKLIPVLIEAIKDQQKQLDEQARLIRLLMEGK